MVVVGFIVEGASERIILESSSFRQSLQEMGLGFIPDVIDVSGGGNLLPKYREESVRILKDKGATHVLILGDQEDAPCITSVKDRIAAAKDEFCVLSIKTLEAWYLADVAAFHRYLDDTTYSCEFPETHLPALNEIIRVRQLLKQRGVADKKILARQMVKSQFSVENAAKHQNCPSARYFLAKLQEISKQ